MSKQAASIETTR